MKGLHGIIFSHEKHNNLRDLTANRMPASVPFAGRYRIIDFILSSMVNAGILEGDGANCNAEEPMNRERATVLFARAMGIRPSQNPDLSNFVDGDEAADWSVGYIDAMADAGIVQGVGNNTLALGASITRGSVVTLLDNAVAEYADQDGASVTGDVDGIVLVAADSVTVDAADVDGGVIVEQGDARQVIEHPREERTRQFLARYSEN